MEPAGRFELPRGTGPSALRGQCNRPLCDAGMLVGRHRGLEPLFEDRESSVLGRLDEWRVMVAPPRVELGFSP